jgi:uncharacterized membrane protein
MKTNLLTILLAVVFPLVGVLAEDTGKSETTESTQQQPSEPSDEMGKGQVLASLKDQDAELDKLAAEMNSASPEKKLDAVAAVVAKLVEQRKAMHEQLQKMMGSNDEKKKCMYPMMSMDTKDDPSDGNGHHH